MSAAIRTLSFSKMHGLGNDFVVIDARNQSIEMTSGLARDLADRSTGIGCDQLIVIGNSTSADVSMQIFNQDGSEVAACGNATRCVQLFVGGDITIETAAGMLHATSRDGLVSVDMGHARKDWDQVPLAYAMDTLTMSASWDNLPAPSAVSVGNPHVVFFVDDLDAIDMAQLGPMIENDPLFPERINVNFAQCISPNHIKLVVWERGAGFTRACGTGACATAVCAIRRKLVSGPVRVSLPGGDLLIEWAPGSNIQMTGPATHVFDGTIDLAAFTSSQ